MRFGSLYVDINRQSERDKERRKLVSVFIRKLGVVAITARWRARHYNEPKKEFVSLWSSKWASLWQELTVKIVISRDDLSIVEKTD